MNHDLKASESVEVNAAPEKVWNALTNPDLIKEYLFGTETVTDWKEGSEVIFQGEFNEHKYRDKGVVLVNKPNKLLSYSYWSGFSGLEDKPENYAVVTYSIEPVSDQVTKFTWIQEGYPDEERQQHSQSGMKEFLRQIKGIMER